MKNVKKALRTKESKEAIGDFWVTLISTGSTDKAVDSMIITAKQNGAVKKIKSGLVTDTLEKIIDYFFA